MLWKVEGGPIHVPGTRLDAIFVDNSKTAPFSKIVVEIAIEKHIRHHLNQMGQAYSAKLKVWNVLSQL